MKRSVPVLLVLVIAILIGASPAADAAMRPSYAVFKGGAYFPGSSDLGGESFVTSADTGLNIEGAFGHYFAPHFALEGGIGVFFTEGETIGFLGGLADETFTAVPVTVSAKAVFPAGPIEPYIMAGVGVYFVEDEVDDPAFGTVTDDDTAAGFHVGAGINFDVSPLVYIGAEVKYLWLEVTTFGVDTELNGATATANVGFRF